jgi:serine phosphatase RsbU (regulator of sigma subunit)
MSTLEMDFGDIAAGLLLSSVGLIAVVISLFRLRSKDFSLLNFGLVCSIYGIRWLSQIPSMKTLMGIPFTLPYFHAVLTFLVVIPLSAFLVNIFSGGMYNSLLWVFRTTIVYAIGAMGYGISHPETLSGASINPIVVVLWCIIWIVNVVFVRKEQRIELHVLRVVLITSLLCAAIDNLVNMHILPWKVHLTNAGFLVLCIGLGYVAVRHFFSNERKLLVIEKEVEIARRIQYSNLPSSLVSPAGIDIAARYVPMSAVAGDFYDIQIKEQVGVGILIADVSGHGIGAALIGSMLKIAFASQTEHLTDPARMLMELNRILLGKMEHSFVTACSLFVDITNGKISYASAGHPPPVLWRKSTLEMRRLSLGGTILGPFPNAIYENTALDIVKDDRIVLYTDGVTETSSKTGELFGEDRLEALIKESSSYSADCAADLFIEHLSKWSGRSRGTSLNDDLTLIIIDVVSEPDVFPLGTSGNNVGAG